jgi:hypothetical protein
MVIRVRLEICNARWDGVVYKTMRRGLKQFLLITILASACLAEDSAVDIVMKAFHADDANEKLARSYTFHERVEEKFLKKNGDVRRVESKTYDITLLDGSEYKRLIAKDDQPLKAKDVAKEDKKLAKSLEKMRNESPKEREKRLREVEKKREKERRFIAEITRAYDFSIKGADVLDGIEAYVIHAEPRPDYVPGVKRAGVLRKLRGDLWISKANHGWMKAEIDTIEDFAWGLFLLKFKKGAQIQFTQQWVNDEVWLMDNWTASMRARALMVGINGEFRGDYSNFRKFSTESTVTFGDTVE